MITGKENKGADIIDLLRQISDTKPLTGVIKAENPRINIISKIFIKNGQIVYGTSTMYRARFGDLMIKKGIITPKELNTALRLQKENSRPTLIGTILVEMGVISERVIPNLLYHQIEVVIYEILSWRKANITFEECNIDEQPDYKPPFAKPQGKITFSDLNKLIDTRAFTAVLEATVDNLLNIRNLLNDPDAVPKRILKIYPTQLSFDQRKILRSIDGSNSLNDIIILSDLDYFRTYQILFDLAAEKVISIPGVIIDGEEENRKTEENNQDEDDESEHNNISYSQNLIETELLKLSTQRPVYNTDGTDNQEPVPDAAGISPEEVITKYKQVILSNREEIKQLKMKINDFENSKIVLSDDLTQRVSRLPYNKKLMLSSAIKNILDMVESI